MQDFAGGKPGTRGNQKAFKVVPRFHLQKIENLHSVDEKVDAGLYDP